MKSNKKLIQIHLDALYNLGLIFYELRNIKKPKNSYEKAIRN